MVVVSSVGELLPSLTLLLDQLGNWHKVPPKTPRTLYLKGVGGILTHSKHTLCFTMLKKVAIALTGAAAIAALLTPAQAEVQQGTLLGFPVVAEIAPPYEVDTLHWSGPQGQETIWTLCLPSGDYTWEAKGPHSAELVDAVAREFCF